MLVDRQRLGQAKVSQLDGASVVDETRPAFNAGRKSNILGHGGIQGTARTSCSSTQCLMDIKVYVLSARSGMALALTAVSCDNSSVMGSKCKGDKGCIGRTCYDTGTR